MSKMDDYTDQDYKHYPVGLHKIEIEPATPSWPLFMTAQWDGPYGTVECGTFVMVDRDSTRTEASTLSMHHEGRVYTRRWEHSFGKKTLARLAREFQEEIYIKSKLKTLKLDDVDIELVKEGRYHRATPAEELALILKYL